MMFRKAEGDEELIGNNRFEGYCKDMMDLIAKRLGINCNCVLSTLIRIKLMKYYSQFTCRRIARSQRSKVRQ